MRICLAKRRHLARANNRGGSVYGKRRGVPRKPCSTNGEVGAKPQTTEHMEMKSMKNGMRILLAASLAMVLLVSSGIQGIASIVAKGHPGQVWASGLLDELDEADDAQPDRMLDTGSPKTPSEDEGLPDDGNGGLVESGDPVIPGGSEAPQQGEDPVNEQDADPGEAARPDVPAGLEDRGGDQVEPEQPVDQGNAREEQVDAGEPEEPVEPEQPEEPTETEEPVEPEESEGSKEAEEPEDPGEGEPEETEEPEQQEQPEELEEPEPEQPEEPGEGEPDETGEGELDDQEETEDGEGPENPGGDTEEAQTSEPALDVTIITDRFEYEAGDVVRLTVFVRNTGTAHLSDVTLRVPLAGLKFPIPSIAPEEEVVIPADLSIPSDFYIGYIGVGAYAECQYEDVSVTSQDAVLLVVDEPVDSDFKEYRLQHWFADWQSVIPLDVIPALDEETLAKLQDEQLGEFDQYVAGVDLSGPKGMPDRTDTVETAGYVTRLKDWGCRYWEVALEAHGKGPPLPFDAVLVVDRSGSMGSGPGSPMEYAKEAASWFAGEVLRANPENQVAVVSFGLEGAKHPLFPLRVGDLNADTNVDIGFSSDLEKVQSAIESLYTHGGTNTQAGFLKALQLMTTARRNSKRVIVLLTDGVPTVSIGFPYGPSYPAFHNVHTLAAISAAQFCHLLGYEVFTVALLGDVPAPCLRVARDTMQAAGNGGYYELSSAEDLIGIYEEIFYELMYSARDVVVTAKIPPNFEFAGFVEPDEGFLPASAEVEGEGTIIWKLGDIANGSTVALSYVIKAQDDYPGGEVYTDGWAQIEYYPDAENDKKVTGEFGFDPPCFEVPPPLTVTATASQNSIPFGVEIQLEAAASGGVPAYYYLWQCDTSPKWSQDTAEVTVCPDRDTTYTVTAKDEWGCIASTSVKVNVKTGSITIKKIVENLSEEEQSKKFTIYVEDPKDGKLWCKTLAAGESATISGLRADNRTYTICEVAPMDYRVVGIRTSHGTTSDGTCVTVTISDSYLEHEVTITNRKVNNSWFRYSAEAVNTFVVRFPEDTFTHDTKGHPNLMPEAVLPEVPGLVLEPEPGDEARNESETHDE